MPSSQSLPTLKSRLGAGSCQRWKVGWSLDADLRSLRHTLVLPTMGVLEQSLREESDTFPSGRPLAGQSPYRRPAAPPQGDPQHPFIPGGPASSLALVPPAERPQVCPAAVHRGAPAGHLTVPPKPTASHPVSPDMSSRQPAVHSATVSAPQPRTVAPGREEPDSLPRQPTVPTVVMLQWCHASQTRGRRGCCAGWK